MAAAVSCGCTNPQEGLGDTAQADRARSPFVDATKTSALIFSHDAAPGDDRYLPQIVGAGVALADFDGDGDLDVYFVQGGGSVVAGSDRTANQYLRNNLVENQALTFSNVTDQFGGADTHYGMGVATGDIDNDGDVDLYVTNVGRNTLYLNDGFGRLRDVTDGAGVGHDGWSAGASFADYDQDGLLDLFVTHYVGATWTENPTCKNALGEKDYCSPEVFDRTSDTLYRNLGNGQFEDVSERSGIAVAKAAGLGVVAADFDQDGWLDFFVANDQSANFLWRNTGDGRFEETGMLSGSAYNAHGMAEASMGVTAADFDGDGDEDLFMTHLGAQTNTLYVNDGQGGFSDGTDLARLGSASLVFTGFGARWFDVDNDTDLDLFVANGAISAQPERAGVSMFPYEQRNQLFLLESAGRYVEWRDTQGGALEHIAVSRGAAFGDLDNDGDTDVVVTNANGPAQLLLNNNDNEHWVGFSLRLPEGKRDAIGARIAVMRRNQNTLWRRVNTDGSYLSANDPRVLIGLGPGTGSLAIGVVWPNGQRERWLDVAPGRYHTLVKGTGSSWPE